MADDMKYIQETPTAYVVEFRRGNTTSKEGAKCYLRCNFSFKDHGGKRRALNAAIVFRDQHRPEHERIRYLNRSNRRGVIHRNTPHNSSNSLPGVTRRTYDGKKGKSYVFYTARWNLYGEDGKISSRPSKRFRCDDYKTEAATEQAAWRHQKRMIKGNAPKQRK